jgi:hypothetical protein
MLPSSCSQCPSHIAIVQNAQRNALQLVARKHVNRCEQRAADLDRAREFCLSQGGFLRIYSAVFPLLFPCYGGRSSPVRVEFNACSLAGQRGFSAISHPCGFRMLRGER